MKNLEANAFVKGLELNNVNWFHEDRLTLTDKICTIDEESHEYIFNAYNHDRKAWGFVATYQIIVFDNTVFDMPSLMDDFDCVQSCDDEIIAIKFDRNKGNNNG